MTGVYPAGRPLQARTCAPWAAGTAWAWRIYAIDTGLSGRTATAPVVFDTRQWQRQTRTARARIAAPARCR